MAKLEKSINTLIGYMIGSEECTVPKLEEWCQQFSETVAKTKSVIAMAASRCIASEDEKAMRVLGEALAVKLGQFKSAENQSIDARTALLKPAVGSALKFHSFLSKGQDEKEKFIKIFKKHPL